MCTISLYILTKLIQIKRWQSFKPLPTGVIVNTKAWKIMTILFFRGILIIKIAVLIEPLMIYGELYHVTLICLFGLNV